MTINYLTGFLCSAVFNTIVYRQLESKFFLVWILDILRKYTDGVILAV